MDGIDVDEVLDAAGAAERLVQSSERPALYPIVLDARRPLPVDQRSNAPVIQFKCEARIVQRGFDRGKLFM